MASASEASEEDVPRTRVHLRSQRRPTTFRRQLAFWLAFAIIVVACLYLFRSILLPFVVGMILAYFLDPLADILEARGFGRVMAAVTILLAFLILVVVLVGLIVPVLTEQISGFITRFPLYLAQLQQMINLAAPAWIEESLGLDRQTIEEGVDTALNEGGSMISTIASSLLSSGAAIIDVATLFVVAPVVAFYMLIDWDRMVAQVDDCVPRDHVDTVRQIALDIDNAVSGFIRGQSLVCLILGVFYAAALTAIGLNFGLLIGLVSGIIGFIPYVGSAVGLIASVGVAAFQFWPDWIWILATAAIFFSGQFVEGNFLQPYLVGNKVGLHPVWLMFALLAFGAMFGFVGVLIAVPAAAAVAVIVRFALNRYLESPLYKGRDREPTS